MGESKRRACDDCLIASGSYGGVRRHDSLTCRATYSCTTFFVLIVPADLYSQRRRFDGYSEELKHLCVCRALRRDEALNCSLKQFQPSACREEPWRARDVNSSRRHMPSRRPGIVNHNQFGIRETTLAVAWTRSMNLAVLSSGMWKEEK